MESSNIIEERIEDAIIRNAGQEIVIDYEDSNRPAQLKLNSNDGIHFKGEYRVVNKIIGICEFDMYKNKEGYFLIGWYSSVNEERGSWWIRLTKNNT